MLTSIKTTPFLFTLLYQTRGPMCFAVAYVSLVGWLDAQYHLEKFAFPGGLITVFGTVVSLLVAFRTNSSYARWWEARILWGAIVNDSRSWTRQVLTFVDASKMTENAESTIRTMTLRQIAWCYALTRTLRGKDATQDLPSFLDAQEISKISGVLNIPNALLREQADNLRSLHRDGAIDTYAFIEMERTLVRLTNHMGGCERIKNTPFPMSYSLMVHLSVYTFVLMLPFGLVDTPTSALALVSITIAFAFLTLERVAIFLQDPFNNGPADTPMLALSRTIDINLKQMLGDTEVPERLQPVNGRLD